MNILLLDRTCLRSKQLLDSLEERYNVYCPVYYTPGRDIAYFTEMENPDVVINCVHYSNPTPISGGVVYPLEEMRKNYEHVFDLLYYYPKAKHIRVTEKDSFKYEVNHAGLRASESAAQALCSCAALEGYNIIGVVPIREQSFVAGVLDILAGKETISGHTYILD